MTEKGAELAAFIAKEAGFDLFLPEEIAGKFGAVPYKALKECFTRLMDGSYRGITAVMAHGIVTRMTAPHLKSKHTDPAVVTCDEVGRYAISSIAGHEGGSKQPSPFCGVHNRSSARNHHRHRGEQNSHNRHRLPQRHFKG
ncbi:MAG: hypothetical protein LRY51_05200 [Geovibrio sp.]|nr:hypothetical protein [Geovibrio sp.]